MDPAVWNFHIPHIFGYEFRTDVCDGFVKPYIFNMGNRRTGTVYFYTEGDLESCDQKLYERKQLMLKI